jgi:hypothetical protein
MPGTKSEPKVIAIPALHVVQLNVRIQGLTPLLCHRFGDSALRQIEAGQQQAAKVKKAARDPRAEFQESIYYTTDGHPAFPAVGIKRAMVSAGSRFAGERSTELLGAFSLPTELIEIDSPNEPAMRSDRVVLSGIGRVSSIAYRAQFQPWSMLVPLLINADFLSADQAVNLLRLAGFSVGIGDWRPEKKGSFGQFQVSGIEGQQAQ